MAYRLFGYITPKHNKINISNLSYENLISILQIQIRLNANLTLLTSYLCCDLANYTDLYEISVTFIVQESLLISSNMLSYAHKLLTKVIKELVSRMPERCFQHVSVFVETLQRAQR